VHQQVDPGDLRLPPDRADGPDGFKLADQIREFGASTDAMPPLWVTVGAGDEMMINNGVTRAYRVFTLSPGTTVPVEIIQVTDFEFSHLPRIRDISP
jgi:hypothetical protein